MHFCQDELMAILGVLPFFGFALTWIRTKFLRRPQTALVRCEERPRCEGHPLHHLESKPVLEASEVPKA